MFGYSETAIVDLIDTFSRKLVAAKPWVTNISIIPHTLGILTANIVRYIINTA